MDLAGTYPSSPFFSTPAGTLHLLSSSLMQVGLAAAMRTSGGCGGTRAAGAGGAMAGGGVRVAINDVVI
jgi:hypothetical protein